MIKVICSDSWYEPFELLVIPRIGEEIQGELRRYKVKNVIYELPKDGVQEVFVKLESI